MNSTPNDLIDATFDNIERLIYTIDGNNVDKVQEAIRKMLDYLPFLCQQVSDWEQKYRKTQNANG